MTSPVLTLAPSSRSTCPVSHAKREQVLAGAEAVFLECGYEGASMSQIAARARVSKGTLYNHFENKAELFRALVDKLAREKLAAMFQPLSAGEEDCLTLLIRVAEEFIRVMISPIALGLYRIIVSEAPQFPELSDMFWQQGPACARRFLTDWLRRQDENRVLEIEDAVFAADQFFALCQTRIVHFRRLELPVDCSAEAIGDLAQRTGRAFLKIYGRDR